MSLSLGISYAFRMLGRKPGQAITIFLSSLLLSLSVIGGVATFFRIDSVNKEMLSAVTLSVFTDPISDSVQVSHLVDTLKRFEEVSSTRVLDSDSLLGVIEADLGKASSNLLRSNPIPLVIEVKLHAEQTNVRTIARLLPQVRALPLVSDAVATETLAKVSEERLEMSLMIFAMVAGLVLGIGLVTTIIALSTERRQRRREQVFLATHGGGFSVVVMPFLLYSIIPIAVAIFASLGLYLVASNYLFALWLPPLPVQAIVPTGVALFVACSCVALVLLWPIGGVRPKAGRTLLR